MSRKYVAFYQRLAVFVLLAANLLCFTPPTAAQGQSGITSPATGAAVSGDVPIFGTAVIEPFQKYELHYKQEPSGDDAYIYFGGSTVPVNNGQLGSWQAGGLPPGTYSIRLRVVKADGNYAEFFAQNLSLNQGPAPTPTSSEPTPTPIPTATFTPAPQPTAAVGAVQQPTVEGAGNILPTPTPAQNAAVDLGSATADPLNAGAEAGAASADASVDEIGVGSFTSELGEALAFDKLRQRFWDGVRYSALFCFAIFALFGGKRLFDWVWAQFR